MKNLKKLLNTAQTQAADQYSILNEPISSIDLMERASIAFVNGIEENELLKKRIVVVCGVGNNGGDGLAVSRILKAKGYCCDTILVKFKETLSEDCRLNLNRLDHVYIIENEKDILSFANYDLIIDAIFGSGINNPVKGLAASLINTINKAEKKVISIDLPSGLYCDDINSSKSIVKADLAISFQRAKLSFFLPESSTHLKNWKTVDIGLNENFIQDQDSNIFILDEQVTSLIRPRNRFSHKGSYGHSLIIAGSYGKIGAAVLASNACLRSGTGLLTTYVPACGYQIIQSSVPEALCLTDQNKLNISTLPDLSPYTSIGIGPGLGKSSSTILAIKEFLKFCKQALVLDADAINILSDNKDLIKLLPSQTILTPHIKEFDRLIGESSNSLERFKKQKQFSIKQQCIVVLKDAHTCISSPSGNLYFNTSGNAGMATGGSGDVLTGIITALLAQHYEPLHAALIAVYFHGKAGDEAAKNKGQLALIASDLIEYLKIE